ncbi:YisB protein [Xylariaceae sp. FL0594]|nr:YisB protein [Xylariaceae sp. FL0594]
MILATYFDLDDGGRTLKRPLVADSHTENVLLILCFSQRKISYQTEATAERLECLHKHHPNNLIKPDLIMSEIPEDEQQNYELFRDCLATALHDKISEPQPKQRKRTKEKSKEKTTARSPAAHDLLASRNEGDDSSPLESTEEAREDDIKGTPQPSSGDDLAEFTDYIASMAFTSLPLELRTADHHTYMASTSLQSQYASRLPLTGADIPSLLPLLDPDISESLSAYGILDEDKHGTAEFLAAVLTSFLTLLATAPPAPSTTKADVDGCEICGRDWINLSYHHLIPRYVHAKAVKRGWHRECDLQNVAWLCGACHRFVHRFANHEELARKYYTVDLLLEQEEVRRWAEWVGRLRWKGR